MKMIDKDNSGEVDVNEMVCSHARKCVLGLF